MTLSGLISELVDETRGHAVVIGGANGGRGEVVILVVHVASAGVDEGPLGERIVVAEGHRVALQFAGGGV